MAGGSAPRGGGIIEGINVTPLVDIMLVLLVIFMVTAKLVDAPALPLDLPQAAQSEQVQTVLAVSITANGQLWVDGRGVREDALGGLVREALGRDPELRAVIQADGSVPHRLVITVLDRLKEGGLTRVAFATAAPPAPGEGGARARP